MSTTKSIAFVVNKIDYMLQTEVVKTVHTQIDIDDTLCAKDDIIRIHYIDWMSIFVKVS
jgi:hypothetical protein